MDIAGAKALKQRLGVNAPKEEDSPSLPAASDEVPPVYKWTGVRPGQKARPADSDDARKSRRVSKFRRLVPSFH
jgi:hypothetical protein